MWTKSWWAGVVKFDFPGKLIRPIFCGCTKVCSPNSLSSTRMIADEWPREWNDSIRWNSQNTGSDSLEPSMNPSLEETRSNVGGASSSQPCP